MLDSFSNGLIISFREGCQKMPGVLLVVERKEKTIFWFFFLQKILIGNVLLSISTTFYEQILRTKVLSKPNSKQRKDVRTKNERIKRWWNWHLLSISATFYEQLLCWYFFAKKITKPNYEWRKHSQGIFVKKILFVKCWWNWHLVKRLG